MDHCLPKNPCDEVSNYTCISNSQNYICRCKPGHIEKIGDGKKRFCVCKQKLDWIHNQNYWNICAAVFSGNCQLCAKLVCNNRSYVDDTTNIIIIYVMKTVASVTS